MSLNTGSPTPDWEKKLRVLEALYDKGVLRHEVMNNMVVTLMTNNK